jgi:hypothetical protein
VIRKHIVDVDLAAILRDDEAWAGPWAAYRPSIEEILDLGTRS